MAPESKRMKAFRSTEESKPSKRVARTRKGKLEELPHMPLDIINEIFSHLLPLDILNLSRTNKAFRAFLMNRSAMFLWKAARRNVPGLPEPFAGMSEPAFAYLCFDTHCHACLRFNTDPIWEFRTRLCTTCKLTRTQNLPITWSRLLIKERRRCLPFIDADVNAKKGVTAVLISDMEEMEAAWNALPESEEARDEFFKMHDSRFKEIREHSEICRRWYENKKGDRMKELYDIKCTRYKEIATKLTNLGYGKDVEYSAQYLDGKSKNALRSYPFVKQSKALTHQSWEKNRAELIHFIQTKITSHRLLEDYLDDFNVHYRTLQSMVGLVVQPKHRPFFPRLRDLVSFPDIQRQLDPHKIDQSNSQNCDYALSIKDELFEKWRADCRRQLEEIIRAEVPDIPEDTVVLDLAVANLMQCAGKACSNVMVDPWPNAVIHDCGSLDDELSRLLQDNIVFNSLHESDQNEWYDRIMNHRLGYKWSQSRIRPLARDIEKIVRICGQDPLRVTAAEMDRLDPRLFCARQAKETGIRTVMRWREAAAENRRAPDDKEWEMVPTSGYVEKIARLELAAAKCVTPADPRFHGWLCAHCEGPATMKYFMSWHNRIRHGIQKPAQDVDFFPKPENILRMESAVYIVSDAKVSRYCLALKIKEAFREGRAAWESDIYGSQ